MIEASPPAPTPPMSSTGSSPSGAPSPSGTVTFLFTDIEGSTRLWETQSAAMAAAFNLIIVRTTFGAKTMRGRDLVSLAVLAGLAINTRASIGVALYLGTTLLLAWAVWHRYASDRTARQVSARPARFSSAILPAIGVLGLAAAVAGFINFERWGNPFSFADFHYYDMRLDAYQTLLEVTRKYGEFGVGRIPIGTLYYLTDLPYLLHRLQPFTGFLHARVVTIDGPPSTPVITNQTPPPPPCL